MSLAPGNKPDSARTGPSAGSSVNQSVTDFYDELKGLARRFMSSQRADHTLQPTALVHEAYMRLIKCSDPQSPQRSASLWLAARAMRSVLVDHARRHDAVKRGGGNTRDFVPLDEVVASYQERAIDLLELDELLEKLEQTDQAMMQVVDMRFFGGLTEQEAADALGLSARTVRRKWALARKWLHARLTGETG